MKLLEKLPVWALLVCLLYMAGLVTYAIYDDRKVDFWPPSIHSPSDDSISEGKEIKNNESWEYSRFLYSEVKENELEDWVNKYNPGAEDIVSAISEDTFHVWVRQGKSKTGQWIHYSEKWDPQSGKNTASGLEHQELIVLGLSNDMFHFLRLRAP